MAGPLGVELLSDRPLGTGLTLLAVEVTGADGAPVTDVAVRLVAWRAQVGGVDRVAPALGLPVPDADGRHRQLVAFPEAAGAADGWSIRVDLERPPEAEVSATLAGLAVTERWLAQPFGEGPVRYLLAVRFDAALSADLNPITASLHATADQGASYAPVPDATFEVEPFMPSMGHGSIGSVAPTPTSTPGGYQGGLAFSMAGDWETTFTVRRGGVVLGRPVITVYF